MDPESRIEKYFIMFGTREGYDDVATAVEISGNKYTYHGKGEFIHIQTFKIPVKILVSNEIMLVCLVDYYQLMCCFLDYLAPLHVYRI